MNTNDPTVRKPLRLWPGIAAAMLLVLFGYVIPIFVPQFAGLAMLWAFGGVAAAVLLVLIGYVIPIVMPQYAGLGMIGAAICALIVILWWLLLSRARWYERVGAIALIVAAVFAEKYVVHASIAGGAMGYLSYILAIPTLCVALVAWAAASRRLAPASSRRRGGRRRRARMPAVDRGTDRWHQCRREVGFPLALDEDSRRAAPRSGRRRTPRRCSGRA